MSSARGVSLIELLIVLAVISIVAAMIFVTLDPIEQFARGRDSSRKLAITQLGHAAQVFFIGSGGKRYPTVSDPSAPEWMQQLIQDGELKDVINGPEYSDGSIQNCNVNKVGEFCYQSSTAPLYAQVWARLESKIDNHKCSADIQNPAAYWVYATLRGQAGLVCGPSDPNFIPNPLPIFVSQ